MQVKQQILNALKNSLVADSQKLKEATDFLTALRQQSGYCILLMEIVDSQNNSIPIKQAALIQLKNTIKMRWKSKKGEIESSDKQIIKTAILSAIIRCSKDHKLVKLYKEILTIIVGHQYKQWIPMAPIIQKLRQNSDLESVMHCLIAIAASFEFSITPEQRSHYFQFLKAILPELMTCLQQNQTPELVFLNLKFLWKAVHYEVNEEVRNLTIHWMKLLFLIVGMENQEYQQKGKISDYNIKNSPQFFYFHSKKWATRILLRFIQKHAKLNLPKKAIKNIEFSQNWYKNFGIGFADILFKQLKIPTATKVRFFQMKCIQSLASQMPDLVKQFAEVLQYQILPGYMQLKQEDQELANSDPIEFLNREMEPCLNFTNLKKVASDVWVSISEIGCKPETEKSKYQPGDFFYNNMNYIKGKLESTNPLEKQFAMFLICQLRTTILKCPEVKAIMPNLISSYIITEFRNQIMFLRARAVDIFYDYGTMGFPIEVLQKATQGIYLCLTQDHHAIVRIKAASAFNCILRHKEAKQLVRPLLKDILSIYLQLLQKYDLEILVNSLQNIVEDFSSQIEPFAHDLTRYMINLFTKLFHKDQQQANNEDYAGQIQLAAAGCLKTVTQIVDSPLSINTIQNLHPEIISLCFFVFSLPASDYIEDLLLLLNSYLHKINILTPELWFFYQVIIYNITGIPSGLWNQIQNSPLSAKQKQVLMAVKGGGNIQMMEQTALVLRNYIRKGCKIMANSPENMFRTNLLQLLLFLVGEVYKKGPGQYSGELQMTCCISLLVNFLENNQNLPEQTILHFWQLARYNLLKNKSKSMKITNIQLICLLIYRGGAKFLSVVLNEKKDDLLKISIKQITENYSKLTEPHEYKRLIFGLSTLVTLQDRPQELLAQFPPIFKLLIKLVKKNVDYRLTDNQIKEKRDINKNDSLEGEQSCKDGSDEQEDLEKMLNAESDDDQQDFWEEMYDDNYESLLDSIDEFKYFEDSMRKIQREEPNFYPQMLKIVPEQQLILLSQKMERAMQLFKPKS